MWSERWLVTNGDNRLSGRARNLVSLSSLPLKVEDVHAALVRQIDSISRPADDCAHCRNPDDPDALRSRSCMQDEAVSESVQLLQEHADTDSGGLPRGQARGRIILPCGTGKTRVSLRIVERLTYPGEVSIVLCPSIALVAQLRREYLEHTETGLRALAVCSDETAGHDPNKEESRLKSDDPTLDVGHVSASEVKGLVTTDPAVITEWMQAGIGSDAISVIFGTYQSAGRVAEALAMSSVSPMVLVCDEAHRTAGLKRKRGTSKAASEAEQRMREFTLCHDHDAFGARYRVYQTATPRVYDVRGHNRREVPQDYVVRSMDDEAVFGVELYRRTYAEAVRNGWLCDYRIIALGVNDPAAYDAARDLARDTEAKGRHQLSTADYLRGLAFAQVMSGAVGSGYGTAARIESCIAFMNTVARSKNMAKDLTSDTVRNWLAAPPPGDPRHTRSSTWTRRAMSPHARTRSAGSLRPVPTRPTVWSTSASSGREPIRPRLAPSPSWSRAAAQ